MPTAPKEPKPPKLKYTTGPELKELRQSLGMNQSVFWNRIGVTQSGGSRYESGRTVPRAVRLLVNIAYGTEKEANSVIDYLTS